MGQTRQNLQRAVKLQQALKVETIVGVLAGLAQLEGKKRKVKRGGFYAWSAKCE